jgi:hypothetical protein
MGRGTCHFYVSSNIYTPLFLPITLVTEGDYHAARYSKSDLLVGNNTQYHGVQ